MWPIQGNVWINQWTLHSKSIQPIPQFIIQIHKIHLDSIWASGYFGFYAYCCPFSDRIISFGNHCLTLMKAVSAWWLRVYKSMSLRIFHRLEFVKLAIWEKCTVNWSKLYESKWAVSQKRCFVCTVQQTQLIVSNN